MAGIKAKRERRIRRHKRARARMFGTKKCPRLCVFRSSNHIYAQLIDDDKGRTLVSAGDQDVLKGLSKKEGKTPVKKEEKMSRKINLAHQAGLLLAKKAVKDKISKVVFDRGGYRYHGRVKALAEGAREGGLKF